MKGLILFLFFLVFFTASVSSAITLDELIQQLQANQQKIKDMQADITTTITSTVKNMKPMEQKGHIWTKGKDKSKMEMYSPMKQITITNGDQMATINPDTGEKYTRDLSKTPGHQSNQGQMDFEKAKEKFDFKMEQKSGGYLITGTPKDDNKFLGRMEVLIDSGKMVPIKITMFNPAGKAISETEIEYQNISGVWVACKNISKVSLPNGKMTIEMIYSDVKVNQGISDREFEI